MDKASLSPSVVQADLEFVSAGIPERATVPAVASPNSWQFGVKRTRGRRSGVFSSNPGSDSVAGHAVENPSSSLVFPVKWVSTVDSAGHGGTAVYSQDLVG